MSHYDIEQWTDFVRGLVSGSEGEKMQAHLAAGCTECRTGMGFLGRLREAAVNEQYYDRQSLPLAASAVRAFAECGRGWVRERIGHALRTIVATLRWDSGPEYQTAGARGARTSSRRLMFEANHYLVDIAVDTHRESASATATGQLIDGSNPDSDLSGIAVFLVAGGMLIGETESNQAGEFIIDYRRQPNLTLQIPLPTAGEKIEISLDQVDE